MKYLRQDKGKKPMYWPQNIPFCSVTKREQGKNILNKKELVKIVLACKDHMEGVSNHLLQ